MDLDPHRTPPGGQRVLARVGRPHGLRGEVTVELRTDSPQSRFAPGTVLTVDPPDLGPLTVSTVRVHQGVYLLGFETITDRTGAEALRGVRLLGEADVTPAASATDPEEFYEEELLGLSVFLPSGDLVGRVSALHTRPAQDLLEITSSDGTTALVPFVTALVPVVDLEAGRLVVDPPPGLLDLDR